MNPLCNDMCYALRMLRKSPVFQLLVEPAARRRGWLFELVLAAWTTALSSLSLPSDSALLNLSTAPISASCSSRPALRASPA